MKTFRHTFQFTFSGLLALGMTVTLHGQNHDDHDHEEEAAHGETHEQHEGHDHHGEHGHHEEGPVQLSPDVMREFGIVVGQASSGTLHETVLLPGEIQYNREAIAYVTPRYDGSVLSINARLADKVKKGQVLAKLESTETLRPFEVTAPFDGVVVAYDITPGQTVQAGMPLFTVADLSTVWADLKVYQRNMDQIHEGQTVRIEGSHSQSAYTGNIAYLAPTVDEHTRTGLARVVIDNPQGKWKPGQFIKGIVSTDEHQAALLVPRSAVLKMEGETVVFVQDEDGFEPRPVELGKSDAQSWEVLEGLKPGEAIVVENPISLKAEMGKGSFGGHHH